jgi:hypothetical protein
VALVRALGAAVLELLLSQATRAKRRALVAESGCMD